jgi:glycosyltransferase involved in cell wall biosynthesis
VVGSNSGAIPEIVGQGGLIVPERDAVAIAAAINQLYADPRLRLQLGIKGRRQVEESYTWAKVASHLRAAYAEQLSTESSHHVSL